MQMCFGVLLALSLLLHVSNQQDAPPGQPLVTCFRCLANRPSCGDTCQGLFCYKSELIIGENDRVVKRGCVNNTDSGARLGSCNSKKSVLPGSNTVSTEKFCICKDHKCNTSPNLSSWSLPIILFVMVFSFLSL